MTMTETVRTPSAKTTIDLTDEGREARLRARVALSLLCEPGDRGAGTAVALHGEAEAVRRAAAERTPAISTADLRVAVAAQFTRAQACGAVCIIPGDPEWPAQLDDLGEGAPLLLWMRGGPLRSDLLRSVSVVGARACTPYGRVATETIASELALHSWTIVSGGAYGIDAAAHRGALAVGGRTVIVSAGGVDRPYPRAHEDIFAAASTNGAVVSEFPMGSPPARHRFLLRNRVIAALTRGTLVVEAASRSGALATVAAAHRLNRHVMAVPGPVTSDLSVGCHRLIRDGEAVLVTSAAHCIELVTPLGEVSDTTDGMALLRLLSATTGERAVHLAGKMERPEDEVMARLVALEGAGLVRRGRRGWTMTDEALRRFASDG